MNITINSNHYSMTKFPRENSKFLPIISGTHNHIEQTKNLTATYKQLMDFHFVRIQNP